MPTLKACIFDLDGVLVDTAEFHFQAWKKLADELGIPFSRQDNEQLKGVSRMQSLATILKLGEVEIEEQQKQELAAKKNAWYLELVSQMTPDDVLPGVRPLLEQLKTQGVKLVVGSASKNARHIMERTHLLPAFDALIDGTQLSRAKPDPEVFLKGAEAVGVEPARCVVLEDAGAGVAAARRGGMRVVGVGSPTVLAEAHLVVPSLKELTMEQLLAVCKAETRSGSEI